jgi:RNA polymerase sigma factor (TIGR02999 family)
VTDITAVLTGLRGQDRRAAMERVLPLVYGELRTLARAHLRHERPDHTLEPTALVHEAWLRLVGGGKGGGEAPPWSDRQHFFRAAAEAMRRILIEHARKRGRVKRGGRGRVRVDLSGVNLASDEDAETLVALDDAFRRLEQQDPEAADVVRLRFFAGLSVAETAQATGRSERTVKREWAFARAWLYDALRDGAPPSG